MSTGRRGFTLVEVAAVVALLGAGAASMAVMSAAAGSGAQPTFDKPKGKPGGSGGDAQPEPKPAPATPMGSLVRARASARQLKCSTQIRGITQSMIIWASNNQGSYPLPSAIDTADATVAEKGRAKDTSANIMSVLIWNGSISPELCICPAEVNKQIRAYEKYEYTMPKKAVKPNDALWDPAFSVDFTKGAGGLSYAHLQPSGDRVEKPDPKDTKRTTTTLTGRLATWSDTYSSTEAILGDRSPEIESVTVEGDGAKGSQYTVKTKIDNSNTLKIHGAAGSWEGNVAYNDGHVMFETTLRPNPSKDVQWARYTTKDGTKRLDTHWYDESDDADATNLFLGIFTTAGKDPKDFRGIWD